MSCIVWMCMKLISHFALNLSACLSWPFRYEMDWNIASIAAVWKANIPVRYSFKPQWFSKCRKAIWKRQGWYKSKEINARILEKERNRAWNKSSAINESFKVIYQIDSCSMTQKITLLIHIQNSCNWICMFSGLKWTSDSKIKIDLLIQVLAIL